MPRRHRTVPAYKRRRIGSDVDRVINRVQALYQSLDEAAIHGDAVMREAGWNPATGRFADDSVALSVLRAAGRIPPEQPSSAPAKGAA